MKKDFASVRSAAGWFQVKFLNIVTEYSENPAGTKNSRCT